MGLQRSMWGGLLRIYIVVVCQALLRMSPKKPKLLPGARQCDQQSPSERVAYRAALQVVPTALSTMRPAVKKKSALS